METIITLIGLVGITFITIIPIYILNGFVITKLWVWFIVPFFGLQQISMAPAIGVALLVSLLTRQYVPNNENKRLEPLVLAFLYPLITLLFGWIVTWFI